ncbi:MAG: zinc ABC transporter substrate-binding protein, partial [Jatrophihabitantaceae bacterium]
MSAHVLRRFAAGGLLVPLALLTACSSAAAGDGSGKLSIVASTDVYGDIARQIAGADAQITSIITDPAQDPHSYEADPRNQLAIAKADIVIENGGGYDDFVDSMLQAVGHPGTVLNAVKISGHIAPPGGELNEHVWYDFPSVQKLVARLVDALTTAEPSDKATFTANAATFVAKLKGLEAEEAQLKLAHQGDGAAITEPVPVYLLDACGLVDKTPTAFSDAVENGTGVPAFVLKQTLDLFSSGQVKLLAYNEQTSGPETQQ